MSLDTYGSIYEVIIDCANRGLLLTTHSIPLLIAVLKVFKPWWRSPIQFILMDKSICLWRRGLLYGVNAGLQESPHRRRILELLAHSAKALSLQKHVVLAPNGHQVPLFTSVDAQGLLGADGRFYILDVFRTFPPDANYCPEGSSVTICGEEMQKESCNGAEEKTLSGNEGWPLNYQKDFGLPKSFSHSLCRLRPELMQIFIQYK